VIPNARLCKALIDRITDRATSSRPGPSPTGSDARWRRKTKAPDTKAKLEEKNQAAMHRGMDDWAWREQC
jgi:hypothetical protein